MDILSNIATTQPAQQLTKRNARQRAQHVAQLPPRISKRGRVNEGGPSLYKPEYCEQVVEYMARGFSLTAFAGSIRVCRDTVQEWENRHPEFSVAVKRARAARLEWLERRLFESESSARVTSSIFALKCTNRDEWGEIQRTEITGKNGGAIQIEEVSDDDLMKIAGISRQN